LPKVGDFGGKKKNGGGLAKFACQDVHGDLAEKLREELLVPVRSEKKNFQRRKANPIFWNKKGRRHSGEKVHGMPVGGKKI